MTSARWRLSWGNRYANTRQRIRQRIHVPARPEAGCKAFWTLQYHDCMVFAKCACDVAYPKIHRPWRNHQYYVVRQTLLKLLANGAHVTHDVSSWRMPLAGMAFMQCKLEQSLGMENESNFTRITPYIVSKDQEGLTTPAWDTIDIDTAVFCNMVTSMTIRHIATSPVPQTRWHVLKSLNWLKQIENKDME